ncbi:TRAP transporter substrate-binding protein [Shimia biformata]|uniref:TRAP transporter substrate-binding protein n=1 Tax=Shimia biformata TaxID=1294299 RepID=UPI00195063A2|nr:TRAP transporter substrate-binding protein DctP [Shimia biformata]
MTLFKSLATAGLVALATVSSAHAETILKLATAAPEQTPWGVQVNRLAELIAKESDGRLKVEPYFNSQLGTENDTLAQLARGRIEMGLFTVNAASQQAPEVGLMQLYGYFDNNDQRACVQDNHLTDEIRARLSSKGVYFGAWAEVGNGYIMSEKALTSPDDLKGLKIGISVNKVNTEHWRAFGANPVPLSPGEVASAASTGLIDIYPTVYTFYIPSGLSKIYPVVNEYNYANGPGMWAVSQRVMDRLSDEDQEAIKRAFADPAFSSKAIMDEIFAFEDKMRALHESQGGKVVTMTDEQVAAFRSKLPPFWEAMVAEFGEDGPAIMKLMEDGKAACQG